MVLLQLLHDLAPQNKWSFSVAHFNHCLRGQESDADEAFVRKAADNLNLPFYSTRADVQAFATENGISIEMAGRELRHRFLIETAIAESATRIALAHHADDNIETFWMRLLRGDVGPGLAGIRWERTAGAAASIRFIRPLLNISKLDLLGYAKERNVRFREDASNANPAFLRNRLRLELLPQLHQFQPALRDITLRTIDVLSAEKAFLETEAQRWIDEAERPFDELHLALQREVLRQQLIRLGIQPAFEIIEELRLHADRPISSSPTRRILRATSGVVSEDRPTPLEFSNEQQSIGLEGPGQCRFGDVDFCWEHLPSRSPAEEGVEYFDADLVGTNGLLRMWAPGDRFQPSGMKSESKVQDLLTNLGIPAHQKRCRVLAVAKDGNIFWVEGLRISERYKVTPKTRRVLRWSSRRVA